MNKIEHFSTETGEFPNFETGIDFAPVCYISSKTEGIFKMTALVPIERIASKIYLIRGMKVMLDRDLAGKPYDVETKVLKQAVRRNIDRFPFDFMFELTKEENQSLRSQNVTLKRGQHSKYLPFAFSEHGVLMQENKFVFEPLKWLKPVKALNTLLKYLAFIAQPSISG